MYGEDRLNVKTKCHHCYNINHIDVPTNLLKYGVTIQSKKQNH